jgi:Zn-dependent protease/CBS domain-containing protein
MKSSFRLFRIAGIDIGIHYSWIFIFLLISWSLAQGFFPGYYPGWSTALYWITGVAAALLLFVSVLIHELAHSLVAQAKGLPVGSITLFLLGGVSNLQEEPQKPGVEFVMAIAGPLSSIVLAVIFFILNRIIATPDTPLAAIFFYLALINGILAVFNLLPGFPLDGGRVLRSILWSTTGNLTRATNIAANVGRVLGWAFIAYGVFSLFTGNFFGGIWIAFIGWFLATSANASRQEITLREQLSGTKVKDIMDRQPGTISPETTVDELVNYIFRLQRRRAVPVAQFNNVVGIVTISDVKEIPHDKWALTPVEKIMTRNPLYTVSPDDDLVAAMNFLSQHDINQVIVLEKGELVGMLTRAEIINHLQINRELRMRRP